MAKITRYNGNLQAFASEALGQERVVFGNNGSPPLESDDLTTNIDSNFERGWGVLPLGNKPPREWFNSVAWVATQLSAYLHQVGVAEWDDEQEYHTGSYAQISGFLFRSTSDDNVGNDPQTDGVNWTLELAPVKTLTALIASDFALPEGTILNLDSSQWQAQSGTGSPSEDFGTRSNGTVTDATGRVWSLTSSGVALSDLDVVDSVFTVNIPTAFSSVGEAVALMGRLRITDASSKVINLETGFVFNEEVRTTSNLSDITITSDDPTVSITRSALTTELGLYAFGNRYAGFVADGPGSALPKIDVLFTMDSTGTDAGVSAFAAINGGFIEILPGSGCTGAPNGLFVFGPGAEAVANGANFTGSRNDAGDSGSGVAAWFGANVRCNGVVASDSYYGIAANNASIDCIDAVATNCLRHGVRADETANVNALNADVTGAAVRGFYAWNCSTIHAKGTVAQNCGSAAYAAINGSTINCAGGNANGSLYGIFAREGSTADAGNLFGAAAFSATNCTDTGIYCSHGSTAVAPGADLTGSSICVDSDHSSTVECQGVTADNAGATAIRARNNSTVHCSFGTALNATSVALSCSGAGSNINAAELDGSGAGSVGFQSLDAGHINARNANAQKGGTPAATDITVTRGAFVSASGATGGLSQTANTVTADGIIFQ